MPIFILVAVFILLVSILVYKKLKNSKSFQSFIEDVTTLDVDKKTSSDIINESEKIKKEAQDKIKQQSKEIKDKKESNEALRGAFEDNKICKKAKTKRRKDK